jgi:hypothetical protein
LEKLVELEFSNLKIVLSQERRSRELFELQNTKNLGQEFNSIAIALEAERTSW